MEDHQPYGIVRHMGLTHAEFLRSLPAAVAGMGFNRYGSRILIADQGRRVEIRLGPEQQRRLASLVLPQTEVSLSFEGVTAVERDAFLKRFDLAFQPRNGSWTTLGVRFAGCLARHNEAE